MKVGELVRKSRSYRRFDEQQEISLDTMKELVDLARLSSSGKNAQPLKYIISCDRETNSLIFPHLAWAAALKDWDGPGDGERPAGYIIILHDTTVTTMVGCDHGIAAQSIMLGAAEKGLGGCMIASVQRKPLKTALGIPKEYDVMLVLALGVSAEQVVIDEIRPDGDTTYWRDSNGVHHVPKRTLENVMVELPKRET